MTTRNLTDALNGMTKRPKLGDVLALGITLEAVSKVGGVYIAPVKFGTDLGGYFEFDDAGTKALIVGIFAGEIDGGNLTDVVATDIKKPDRFARLDRRAWCLGNWFNWWEPTEPLPVWRNPISWLRNDGAGIVIFDFAEARHHLPDRVLVPEDDTHGRQIHSAIQPKPWGGRIMVRQVAA